MEYVTTKRFKKRGISARFNIPAGTVVQERDGVLYSSDGFAICRAESENGTEYFRPNTSESEYRHGLLEPLFKFYTKHERFYEDFDVEHLAPRDNFYWKGILRDASTETLERLYEKRIRRLK